MAGIGGGDIPAGFQKGKQIVYLQKASKIGSLELSSAKHKEILKRKVRFCWGMTRFSVTKGRGNLQKESEEKICKRS